MGNNKNTIIWSQVSEDLQAAVHQEPVEVKLNKIPQFTANLRSLSMSSMN